MAFVREIGRNGVLNSGIWLRHGVSNQIESSEEMNLETQVQRDFLFYLLVK